MLSNSRMFNSNPSKINAPMFIYSILYDKPSPKMSGRVSEHPHKLVNNIDIDKAIPINAINKLFKIKEIETRSSCQGTSLELPTFLIFRSNNQDINYVKKLVDNLNKQKDIKCGYDMGNNNKLRIGITTKLFYSPENKSKFNLWWNSLSSKIQNSLPK